MNPDDSSNSGVTTVKAVSIVIMFIMVMILGNLPLRWKLFKTCTGLISLASGFSGGLFLAIAVLHLLTDAQESMNDYYHSQGTEDKDHFPWPNFITVVSFAFILWIEKVVFVSCISGDNEGHGHSHDAEGHVHLPIGMKKNIPQDSQGQTISIAKGNEEEAIKPIDYNDVKLLEIVRLPLENAQIEADTSASYKVDSHNQHRSNKLTPYILQIAIGIHGIFEGLAIGIQTDFSPCLGIVVAVLCHKWAEGLTLGLAFSKANVELKMATIMIAIQALMNPIGVMIGWLLSNQGDLIEGIFESISAGTFLYIATVEVIVNEFSMKRFRHIKFVLFIIAIGFVTSLYFIEQATGS